MSRKSHPVHIPEDYSDKDMSRAQFERPPGQVGIYIEINDAEPVDAHAYGSHLYFLRLVADRLGEQMRKVPLDKVKGVFERKNLIADTIFENYAENNVIAVGFESITSLSDIWTLQEKGLLTPIFQDLFITDNVLKHLEAKSIQLITRMWEDEYEQCKSEIVEGRVPELKLDNRENDQAMIRKVKKYHPTLAEVLLKLKDALNKFDQSLGEFIMILKQNLPKDVEKISSYREFLGHVTYIKKKRSDINGRILDGYTRTLRCINESIQEVEDHVIHPLLQVHAACESEYQRDLKKKMRDSLHETKQHLQPNYDFYRLNHKEWQAKILLREQKLFLGLISVLAQAVDTVVEIDGQTDEYMSALQIKIKV